jgi:hypothetical protein
LARRGWNFILFLDVHECLVDPSLDAGLCLHMPEALRLVRLNGGDFVVGFEVILDGRLRAVVRPKVRVVVDDHRKIGYRQKKF